jgi:hypothetical protein
MALLKEQQFLCLVVHTDIHIKGSSLLHASRISNGTVIEATNIFTQNENSVHTVTTL